MLLGTQRFKRVIDPYGHYNPYFDLIKIFNLMKKRKTIFLWFFKYYSRNVRPVFTAVFSIRGRFSL